MARKYNILVHWTFRPIRLRLLIFVSKFQLPTTGSTQQPASARLGAAPTARATAGAPASQPRACLSQSDCLLSRKISNTMKSAVRDYGSRYRWQIRYTFSDETPTHICIHFIFIANKCSGLHYPSNDIYISSLKFFWWFVYFDEGAFQPFKVIQGQ